MMRDHTMQHHQKRLRIAIAIILILLNITNVVKSNIITISNTENDIMLGETVQVHVSLSSVEGVNGSATYWPFVNGSQWGSFCTIDTSTQLFCKIQIPIPRSGTAQIQIAKLDRMWCQNDNCFFPVGQQLPSNIDKGSVSNVIKISVKKRKINSYNAKTVCMDWEPWFTRNNLGDKPWLQRPGAEGVPIVGLYSSFNSNVVRQHAIWFAEAGINCILVDWSNNLWRNISWEDRPLDIQEIINATTFALKEYENMRNEGLIATPRVVIMTGLLNGPISNMASTKALEKQANWIYTNYILKFGIENFLVIDEKPVLVMLDTETTIIPNVKWNITTSFTLRWMGTQLQNTPFLGLKSGFWSWMDGSYEPIPAMRSLSGNHKMVEALTVTPGFFTTHGGWLDKSAGSYNAGATFIKTMETAMKLKPEILIICQWNEFAGQSGGPPGLYVDSYNISLTNDMEPISLSECAYVRPDDEGQLPICNTGWGFFPLNLLKASLSIFHNIATTSNTSSVLRIMEPKEIGTVVRIVAGEKNFLNVTWTIIGAGIHGKFDIYFNQQIVQSNIINTSTSILNLDDLKAKGIITKSGMYEIKVVALNGYTRFNLSHIKMDKMMLKPNKTASATRIITIET